MAGQKFDLAPEFELTIEDCADLRPLPGFHVTRTRTFFVDNYGQAWLLSAPGHRAMLQRISELPADAEPTRAIEEPDLWMMARAAQSMGRGGELSPLSIADYFAWRAHLFHVRAGQVFELRRDGGARFVAVSALPPGAVPFTETEAEQLGDDIHQAARLIGAPID
jgi:hypothetical protein